jgi:hypothetical protein
MDVTVGYGSDRVANIHLISQQQTLMMFGGFIFLGGLILFAVARIKQTPEDEAKEEAERNCPFCAEMIKAEAVICRYCQRELPPIQESTPIGSNSQPNIQQPLSDAEQMEKYGISYDGERYIYNEYKYDKLSDAIAAARRTTTGAEQSEFITLLLLGIVGFIVAWWVGVAFIAWAIIFRISANKYYRE